MQWWDWVSWRRGRDRPALGAILGSETSYRSLLVHAEARKKDRKPPGITLPCYKLKRKQVVVGDGSLHAQAQTLSISALLDAENPRSQPLNTGTEGLWEVELTSGSYSFREVTLGIWKSCVSSELVELQHHRTKMSLQHTPSALTQGQLELWYP